MWVWPGNEWFATGSGDRTIKVRGVWCGCGLVTSGLPLVQGTKVRGCGVGGAWE